MTAESNHDEDERTPLIADISLWQWFRITGMPPHGADAADIDRAFDRIIRGARRELLLAEALERIAAIADDHPDGEWRTIRDIAQEALYGD